MYYGIGASVSSSIGESLWYPPTPHMQLEKHVCQKFHVYCC